MYAPVRNDFLTIQLAVFYKAYTEKVLNSSFFLIIIMRRRECNVKLGFHWFMYISSEFIYHSLIIKYILIRRNLFIIHRDKL